MTLERLFFGLGAASAFIAVALGAFAAHGLKARLGADLLAAFETGVRYQMFHALALSGVRGLGIVTPFGGLAFLAGWLCLAWTAIRA
jgi:uncharacterized membrane protein YgdD (TMEM256/DUF423 family)